MRLTANLARNVVVGVVSGFSADAVPDGMLTVVADISRKVVMFNFGRMTQTRWTYQLIDLHNALSY